jgi:hypothetical protein
MVVIGNVNNSRMKYKLLSAHTEKTVNIGDYIQALASLQFLPSFDGFVEREGLNSYSEEECTVIMNGWFMHNPNLDSWPIIPIDTKKWRNHIC